MRGGRGRGEEGGGRRAGAAMRADAVFLRCDTPSRAIIRTWVNGRVFLFVQMRISKFLSHHSHY